MTDNQEPTKAKKEKRLEIAISLLQGKVVVPPNDGYDPGRFYQKEVSRLVKSALDIANQLIEENEEIE